MDVLSRLSMLLLALMAHAGTHGPAVMQALHQHLLCTVARPEHGGPPSVHFWQHRLGVIGSALAQVPLPEEEVAKSGARPDRLAIGGQGGFQVDAERFSIAKEHALVVLPEFLRVPLPCPDLPELVLGALSAVMVTHTVLPCTLRLTAVLWLLM